MLATIIVRAIGPVVVILGLLGLLAVSVLHKPDSTPVVQRNPIAVQRELESEYEAITLMPGSTRTSFSSRVKDRTVLVSAYYSAGARYAAVRAYYDGELTGSAWQFCSEDKIIGGGQDLGGMAAYYRKADLRAELDFAGERANYGWTYALGLSWGLSDDCR